MHNAKQVYTYESFSKETQVAQFLEKERNRAVLHWVKCLWALKASCGSLDGTQRRNHCKITKWRSLCYC